MIVFVHGINGDAKAIENQAPNQGDDTDYTSLYPAVKQHYRVFNYYYYQDRGYQISSSKPPQCTSSAAATAQPTAYAAAVAIGVPTLPPPPDTSIYKSSVPINYPNSVADNQCDSQSDLGVDAYALNHFLLDDVLSNTPAGSHITIIAHSMGGAITRGWLALIERNIEQCIKSAPNPTDPATTVTCNNIYNPSVDSVIFLQGAQQGSYLANLGRYFASQGSSIINPVDWGINQLITLLLPSANFYRNRPAVNQLTPQSDWYNDVNTTDVPHGIQYFNFYSDIRTVLAEPLASGYYLVSRPYDMGDLVMLPGTDNPHDTPLLGGAEFRPATGGYEWQLPGHQLIVDSVQNDISQATILYNNPASHFAFTKNKNMDKPAVLTVPDCHTGKPTTPLSQILNILANPNSACS